MKKDVLFQWHTEQENALEQKNILSSPPVLKYFNIDKPVTISCGGLVAFFSRSIKNDIPVFRF